MGAESFQKRERERKRQARAAERRQRRENRGTTEEEEVVPVDTDALMERFRVLSEQHAGGEIDSETYEAERTAIFEELGLN